MCVLRNRLFSVVVVLFWLLQWAGSEFVCVLRNRLLILCGCGCCGCCCSAGREFVCGCFVTVYSVWLWLLLLFCAVGWEICVSLSSVMTRANSLWLLWLLL